MDELLEPLVAAERVEVRIDPEPAGRPWRGERQDPLQMVERLFLFADQDVDSYQIRQKIHSLPEVSSHRHIRHGTLALSNGFFLASEVGEGQAQGRTNSKIVVADVLGPKLPSKLFRACSA